ncbi:uncharacterized protein LOC111049972 isoform X2 [Nilaparvata lugens]|uniref:uncharacterized protein LOC111049972 isoform X2 n=1 Tax=Nilaparvata lugens TaxID=108931 RepID=UPI00193E3360|nr:uncharacterized protein LOC111049972 isoform X2 [Nilaparvata lugens]
MNNTKEPHRDVSWPLQKLRAFLLGRDNVSNLIFKDGVSTYSPNLPSLPHPSKLSDNFYFSRDAMREVVPPTIIAPQEDDSDCESTPRTPGEVYGDTCVPCSHRKPELSGDYRKPYVKIR